MRLASEIQHLSMLRRNKLVENEKYQIYKACVGVAHNGIILPEEATLSYHEKKLLEVRRNLYLSQFSDAEKTLKELGLIELNSFFEGDRLFLIAQLFHRQGLQDKATAYMVKAADQYALADETHREMRARVNAAICLATLESCLVGELYSFEQECRRYGFSDIVANIARTRAIELLRVHRAKEAHFQAMQAADFYLLDGYQDDRSIALILAAIALLTAGDVDKAIECRNQVLVVDGKVENYIKIYDALLNGKKPLPPTGHPLESFKWKDMILKKESVPGKIVTALQGGPQSRDVLIEIVWGSNSLSDSYCSRLYSAMNFLRKEKGIDVKFNGERYYL